MEYYRVDNPKFYPFIKYFWNIFCPKILAKVVQWLKDFSDEKEREKYTHSLGNLTLLAECKNNQAENKDF
ncbi:GmrSD restriction endonuclease domain-containing protein [Helicobacter cetorum]|nr:DUF1524 domain-containing protein [Helicobacter cetorum]